MAGLTHNTSDDYLPFDIERKYIIIDKNNEHYGELIRIYNEEKHALFYDFESGWYLFDDLIFLGIHSRDQLAKFSAVTKEMTYGTIAVCNNLFVNEELVKLIPCPVDTSMFNFPKELIENMNKRNFEYSTLDNPDNIGSTTEFTELDIIKLGETKEEIDTYLEKYSNYIRYLRPHKKDN